MQDFQFFNGSLNRMKVKLFKNLHDLTVTIPVFFLHVFDFHTILTYLPLFSHSPQIYFIVTRQGYRQTNRIQGKLADVETT